MVFDVLGQMWATMLVNGMTLLCSLACIAGVCIKEKLALILVSLHVPTPCKSTWMKKYNHFESQDVRLRSLLTLDYSFVHSNRFYVCRHYRAVCSTYLSG